MNSYWHTLRNQITEYNPQCLRFNDVMEKYPYLQKRSNGSTGNGLNLADEVKNRILRMELTAINDNLDEVDYFMSVVRQRGGQDIYDVFDKMYFDQVPKELVLADYHYSVGQWNRKLSEYIKVAEEVMKQQGVKANTSTNTVNHSKKQTSVSTVFRTAASKYQKLEIEKIELSIGYQEIENLLSSNDYYKNDADYMTEMIALCDQHNGWVNDILEKCSKAYKPYVIRLYLLGDKEKSIAEDRGITDRRLRMVLNQTLESAITSEMVKKYSDISDHLKEMHKRRKTEKFKYLPRQL